MKNGYLCIEIIYIASIPIIGIKFKNNYLFSEQIRID